MENNSRISPNQLIDQHKTFNRISIQKVVKHIQHVNKNYYTVAIIGVQNSGKSTLLNKLFGTNFDVLHQIAGTRTTRGILASLDKQKDLIIMDVEGNDAMDRAEQQDYEKMVSTFALVAANVLIINIWAKSLGQYTGSQYQTLTVIMDICISQFKQQSPKTILFCVRDFNQQTDQEGQIRRKIIKDVNNIWLKIQKPKEFQKYQTTPQKFFNVEVSVLKKFNQKNPVSFLKDVQNLRKRFVNENQEGYAFTKQKTAFNLPITDLPELLENSWKAIMTNKKLNLPNEKQQLSNFRCSDIFNQLLQKFKNEMKVNGIKVVNLGQIFQRFSQQFQKKTYNYGKKIVQQKQQDLKKQMNSKIMQTLNQILESQEKLLKDQFQQQSGFLNQETSKSLIQKLQLMKNQTIQKYMTVIKTLNHQITDRKQRIQKLAAYLTKKIVEVQNTKIELFQSQFHKNCSRTMRLLSSQVLKDNFTTDFWKNTLKIYNSKKQPLVAQYVSEIKWAKGISLTPNQLDQIDESMLKQLRSSIKQQLQKSLVGRVFDFFIKRFTKNEEGISYSFNILQQQKISELYDRARDQAHQIISFINSCNIKSSKRSSMIQDFDNEDDGLFESTWLSNAEEQLDRRMIHEHQTIIRRKKEDQMKKVPIWLIVFILYFVYDDVWFSSQDYPFTNFVLTMFLVFVAFFYSIGQQKAFHQLFSLSVNSVKQGVEKIRKKIQKQ